MDEGEARGLASRVASPVARTCLLGDHEMWVTSSVGVVVAAGPGPVESQTLLREADAAMYRAEAAGKACCEVVDLRRR